MDADLRSRIDDESGFTLIELMTAMATMITVALASMAMLDFAVKTQPQIADQNATIQKAQIEVERLTRELRQTYRIISASPTQLTVLTYSNRTACGSTVLGTARKCQVVYSCSGGTCTRTASEESGAAPGPTRSLVSGLSSDSVFTFTPNGTNPYSVQLTLTFPTDAGDTTDEITISDGVTLRNISAVTS